MTLTPPRIALVLGAGGVPGGAYIRAAMAELEAITGWVPASATTVVGTSVGALNAARLPLPDMAPMPSAAQLASLGGLGRRLPPPDSSVLTSVIARIRLAGGQVAARLAPAGSHPQDYDVAQAPYHPGVMAVSVQRRGGRRRIARLVEATSPEAELYASAAVPGYVSPVVVDGEEHIDGAVWSSTNADLIGLDDHDGLVVIAPMPPSSAHRRTSAVGRLGEAAGRGVAHRRGTDVATRPLGIRRGGGSSGQIGARRKSLGPVVLRLRSLPSLLRLWRIPSTSIGLRQ